MVGGSNCLQLKPISPSNDEDWVGLMDGPTPRRSGELNDSQPPNKEEKAQQKSCWAINRQSVECCQSHCSFKPLETVKCAESFYSCSETCSFTTQEKKARQFFTCGFRDCKTKQYFEVLPVTIDCSQISFTRWLVSLFQYLWCNTVKSYCFYLLFPDSGCPNIL